MAVWALLKVLLLLQHAPPAAPPASSHCLRLPSAPQESRTPSRDGWAASAETDPAWDSDRTGGEEGRTWGHVGGEVVHEGWGEGWEESRTCVHMEGK